MKIISQHEKIIEMQPGPEALECQFEPEGALDHVALGHGLKELKRVIIKWIDSRRHKTKNH